MATDTTEPGFEKARAIAFSGSVEDRLTHLEYMMGYHKHTGSDMTQKIGNAVTIYHGRVEETGDEGTPFPTGWTSVKNSTGRYTVTHNLGTTNYTLLISGQGIGFFFIDGAPAANDFDVGYNEAGGSLGDRNFYFTVFTG